MFLNNDNQETYKYKYVEMIEYELRTIHVRHREWYNDDNADFVVELTILKMVKALKLIKYIFKS